MRPNPYLPPESPLVFPRVRFEPATTNRPDIIVHGRGIEQHPVGKLVYRDAGVRSNGHEAGYIYETDGSCITPGTMAQILNHLYDLNRRIKMGVL